MSDVGNSGFYIQGKRRLPSQYRDEMGLEIEHLIRGVEKQWQTDRSEALILADRLITLRSEHGLIGQHVHPDVIVSEGDRLFHDKDHLYKAELSDQMAAEIGAYYYRLIEEYRYRDLDLAQAYGDALVRLGKSRFDKSLIGLGFTGLGEVLAAQGTQLRLANEYLIKAQTLFIEDGNVIGWAKTLAAQVFIAIEVNRTDTTLRDADTAREILLKYKEHKAAVTLNAALMKVYKDLGRFQQIVELYEQTYPIARTLGISGEYQTAILDNNVGQAYLYSGRLSDAKAHFLSALEILNRLEKVGACRVVQFNLAFIELFWGNYQAALDIAYTILEPLQQEPDPSIQMVHVQLQIAECYLNLNRYAEIETLAADVLDNIEALDGDLPYELANIYRYLAISQVETGRIDDALANFEQSENLFGSVNAKAWQYDVIAWRGEAALRLGHNDEALALSRRVLELSLDRRSPNYASRAQLTLGHAALALGRFQQAKEAASRVLHTARRCRMPAYRYKAHILLGKIAQQQTDTQRAKRHFQAASIAIQGLQKGLNISLQTDFWEDKRDVLNALMRIALAQGDVQTAFETLEMSKSQVLLTYLANHERHQWLENDPESDQLIRRLNELRQEHHFYYRLVNEPDQIEDEACFQIADPNGILRQLERQIKVVTERLYIQSARKTPFVSGRSIPLDQIQTSLQQNEQILQFFGDEQGWFLFRITPTEIEVIELEIKTAALIKLIEKYQFNLRCAAQPDLDEPMRRHLFKGAFKIGQKLYDHLLGTVSNLGSTGSRLTLVPYGLLHYIPFNALHTGESFLIESHELVILPASGLKQQVSPRRAPGAQILANSNGGKLPKVLDESRLVAEILNGELVMEEKAVSQCLERSPGQILHIAAHGKHRIDEPSLSFIQLSDEQLFPDDLLQSDLGYELVVLSACETGRAVVKTGEELIGLSQAVLCAGAGALIASQWQVEDKITSEMMQIFYDELLRGASKAAALRASQVEMLTRYPDLHPLFWAPFQLIGNPEPLSHLA